MDQTLLKYWKTCLQDAERKAIALKGPRIIRKSKCSRVSKRKVHFTKRSV